LVTEDSEHCLSQ